MAKKTRASVPVEKQPKIDANMQRWIKWLSNFYSPARLQLRLEEHLAGLPPGMPTSERLQRITALKLMGYKDKSETNNKETK